ncbi:MAG: tetratricopeptide repeat protein, partial [Bacteroidetes bacterium]|nr:tetratricopeptide repeat protein [Bacteroidota bacterium]
MRRIISFIALLLFATGIYAQDGMPSSKAQKLYNSAISKFNEGKVEEGEKLLLKATEEDSAFGRAYYMLSELYYNLGRTEDCVAILEKNNRVNGMYDSEALYYLGIMYLMTGKYDKAKASFEKHLDNKRVSGTMRNRTNDLLLKADFAINAINNPVPFKPVNLGSKVNSSFPEYLPAVTADEQYLLFTRFDTLEEANRWGFYNQEDFYQSVKIDGEWSKAVNLGPPMNTAGNEGAQTFSPDGQFIFFTSCTREDRYGDCDLFYARKSGDAWSAPVNLGKDVNSAYRESEPTFSSDGRTLIFVSDRPGGYGQHDLWMTTLADMGFWTRPVNLGKKINTEGYERSPFLHPDNRTLYFASDGHIGMGARDLFYSRKDEK